MQGLSSNGTLFSRDPKAISAEYSVRYVSYHLGKRSDIFLATSTAVTY